MAINAASLLIVSSFLGVFHVQVGAAEADDAACREVNCDVEVNDDVSDVASRR
jgi:hypothetical protein